MLDSLRVRVAGWLLKENPVGHLLGPSWNGQRISAPENYEQLSEQGYNLNAIGMTAINKVAETAASLPIKLQRHGKGGAWEDLDASEDDEHPLMQLLLTPNPDMTKEDFFGSIFKTRLISGEGPVCEFGPTMSGPPLELWPMRPDHMLREVNEAGTTDAWVYKTGKGEHRFDMTGDVKPVLFWKTYNPTDQWRGRAPLAAAAWQILQHNEVSKWNARTLKNGMRPAGAFINARGDKSGRPLTSAQRKQLEADIDTKLMGSQNAERPLILDGMEFQQMSLNAKDLDWLEGRRDADRIICLVVGCPPLILGIPGDNTYANYEEANLSLVRDSAIPLLQSLLNELNKWLVPRYGKGLRLAINKKLIDAFSEAYAKDMERIDKCTFMSIDEKREKIGLPALGTPGGKTVFISSSMVPVDMAAEGPEEPEDELADTEEDDGKPKKPLKAPPKKTVMGALSQDVKALEGNLLQLARAFR